MNEEENKLDFHEVVERYLKNNEKFVNSKKGIFWQNVKRFVNIFTAFAVPFVTYKTLKQQNILVGLLGFILSIPMTLIAMLHYAILSIGSFPLFLFGEALPYAFSKKYRKDFKASLLFKKLNEQYKVAKQGKYIAEQGYDIRELNNSLNKMLVDNMIEIVKLGNDEIDISLIDEDYEKNNFVNRDVHVSCRDFDEQEKTYKNNQTFDNIEDSENDKTKDNDDGLQL